MSHAGPPASGRRSKKSGRSGSRIPLVLVGVPLCLAGLALAIAAVAPSSSGADVAAVPAATVAPATPVPIAEVAEPAPDVAPSSPTPVDATTTTGSESGQSGRSAMNEANPGLDVVWRIDTEDPVFFITVDDNIRDEAVAAAGMRVVETNQIPITAFLTTNYIDGDTDYFQQVTRFGGSIQNHTVTHSWLDRPETDPRFELCTAQDELQEQFGSRPWMIRPPYGAPYIGGSNEPRLEAAAAECGVNRIVMWSAVVDNGNVSYNPGPTLQAGDIVLFHFWDPQFAEGLQMILDIGAANGLRPAALEDYL